MTAKGTCSQDVDMGGSLILGVAYIAARFRFVLFLVLPTPIPISLLTTGIITLNPRYGNMLGGSSILVSGPYFTVQEEDQITCLFNDTEVDGIFVNNQQVLCVSPTLSQTGRVPFQLLVTGETEFIGQSVFVSGKFRSVVVSCVNAVY